MIKAMAAKQVTVTEYQERVYTLLKQIPEGKVSTYAWLSNALGSSPRAVGGALRRNPFAPEVPCHRVISADGVSQNLFFFSVEKSEKEMILFLRSVY